MTRTYFQKKYYPAVKETLYQTRLENGLTVTLLPKKDFNEVYGVVSVQVGSVDTRFTVMIRTYNNIHKESLIS